MNRNFILKLNKKRIAACVMFSILFSMLVTNSGLNFTYARRYENKEVDKPIAEESNSISKGIIIDPNKYEILSPLNPTPSTVKDTAEYKYADTFIISLEILPYRVEYFSPTYQYVLTTAKNRVRTSLYSAGGGENTISAIRDTVREFPSNIRSLNSEYKTLNKQLRDLKKAGATDEDEVVIKIKTAMSQIDVGINTIKSTNMSLSAATSGYNKVLNLVNNVDRNIQVFQVKNLLTKSMIQAYLSYLKLNYYQEILENQVVLYENIYNLYKKNYELGLATLLDVDQHKINYQNAKKNLSSTKATKKNVKQLLADNLGYKLTDVDKLVFAEPTIDMNYVNSINIADDYSRAYYSNSTYDSIRSAGESNKRLPESTGRDLYERRLNDTKDKVIAGLDVLYSKLMSAKILYDSLDYQKEMLELSIKSADIKKETNLVSQNEYLGLKIQNLATKMNIKTIEYDFVTAIYNYYYGTYGLVDIS